MTLGAWAKLGAGALCVLGLLGSAPHARGQSDAPSDASARPATAYFHEAAQQYIAENVADARQIVEAGLAAHPSDPRLQALRDKLQRSGSGSSADSSSQQQGGQSEQKGEKGPASESDRQDTEDGEQGASSSAQNRSSTERSRSDASRSDPSESSSPDSRSSPDASQEGQTPPRDGSPSSSSSPQRGRSDAEGREGRSSPRLSRAQAERILRALQGQEQQLLREVQKRSSRPVQVEKDW